MKKGVLVISAAAPPSGGSHATRIAALVEELAVFDYRVTLVTCRWDDGRKNASGQFQRLKDISRVIEANGGILRSSAERLGAIGGKPGVKQRIIQRLRRFVRAHSMPDTYVSWIPSAVKMCLRSIKGERAEVLISSGAPFSSHIAAYIVSRVANVPLILDYGDPWVYEPGRPKKGVRLWLERKLEELILRHSKLVTVTTSATVQLYKDKFPKVKTPFSVVPMGFDETDFQSYFAEEKLGCEKLNFLYTGRINEEYRSIDDFLILLRNIKHNISNKICFHFYGSEFAHIRRLLIDFERTGLIKFHGSVDHSDYIRLISDADGLILFGNNNYVQIPGKVADYLRAKKPILYFSNLRDIECDPTLGLIESVQPEGVFDGKNINEFYDFVGVCESGEGPGQDENELERLWWPNCWGGFVKQLAEIT